MFKSLWVVWESLSFEDVSEVFRFKVFSNGNGDSLILLYRLAYLLVYCLVYVLVCVAILFLC